MLYIIKQHSENTLYIQLPAQCSEFGNFVITFIYYTTQSLLYVLFQVFDIGVYVCLCNKSPDPNHSGPLTLSLLSKYPWKHSVISCST